MPYHKSSHQRFRYNSNSLFLICKSLQTCSADFCKHLLIKHWRRLQEDRLSGTGCDTWWWWRASVVVFEFSDLALVPVDLSLQTLDLLLMMVDFFFVVFLQNRQLLLLLLPVKLSLLLLWTTDNMMDMRPKLTWSSAPPPPPASDRTLLRPPSPSRRLRRPYRPRSPSHPAADGQIGSTDSHTF